jgi:hypothetical protein
MFSRIRIGSPAFFSHFCRKESLKLGHMKSSFSTPSPAIDGSSLRVILNPRSLVSHFLANFSASQSLRSFIFHCPLALQVERFAANSGPKNQPARRLSSNPALTFASVMELLAPGR